MRKNILVFLVTGFWLLVTFAYAQEQITITTYYPSPYGSYRELRADQMAIGSTYRSRTLADGNLLVSGSVGIGTADPGGDRLDVRGRAYASGGWQTTDADYAEWLEKEEDAKHGDIIGINLETGKVRKYRPGDKFVGIYSTNPAYVGNRLKETDEEMSENHLLVALLGQLEFNKEQVKIERRIVKTIDDKEIGILLSNGKVLIGR